LAVILALPFSGCKGIMKQSAEEPTVNMGTTVAVGGVKYTVFQSEWRDNLDTAQTPRLPRNRFLLLQVAVENATGGELGIPMLQLINEKGDTFDEESNGTGVQDWLGFLRVAKPNATERGVVLFDVPQTGYKLRVSSGDDDPEKEKTALIDIPLRVDVEPQSVTAPMDPQAAPK
jgi:hypothetical protein